MLKAWSILHCTVESVPYGIQSTGLEFASMAEFQRRTVTLHALVAALRTAAFALATNYQVGKFKSDSKLSLDRDSHILVSGFVSFGCKRTRGSLGPGNLT